MIGIIMIPSTVHAEGYTALGAIEDVKMSRLVLYEEALGRLHKECSSLLRGTGRALGIGRVCFSSISGFVWNASEYKLTSIESLVLLLEQRVRSLSECFASAKALLDESRLVVKGCQQPTLMRANPSLATEKYEFIDCLHCAVESGAEDGFRALHLAAVVLKRDTKSVLYKIYCLKKESGSLLELLGQKYTCWRPQGGADEILHAQGSMMEAEKQLRVLFDRIVNTELHIGLLRAYAESLHRFGLPPKFRYKLSKDVKKELKELCASNRRLPRAVIEELPLVNILEIERQDI